MKYIVALTILFGGFSIFKHLRTQIRLSKWYEKK